jgi:GxxExxY protein
MDIGYRIDLLVNDQIIIEVKSVEELHPVHKKQLLTYLKLMDKRIGLLVNFNVARMENKVNILRVINELSARSARSAREVFQIS